MAGLIGDQVGLPVNGVTQVGQCFIGFGIVILRRIKFTRQVIPFGRKSYYPWRGFLGRTGSGIVYALGRYDQYIILAVRAIYSGITGVLF